MADGFAELNTVLEGLDYSTEAPPSDQPTDNLADVNQPQDTGAQADTSAVGDASSAQQPQPQVPPTQTQQNAPSSRAFAEMRANNSRMTRTMERLGALLNMGNLKGEQLLAAIENNIVQAEAKQQNISPEVAARLHAQDQVLQSLIQEKEKATVLNSFSQLQRELNLTKDQVYGFVSELQTAGYNLESALPHLVQLYRGMHYEELTNQAVQAAVQRALTHDNTVAQHSTTPGNNTGAADIADAADKINTVSALDDVLRDVKI